MVTERRIKWKDPSEKPSEATLRAIGKAAPEFSHSLTSFLPFRSGTAIELSGRVYFWHHLLREVFADHISHLKRGSSHDTTALREHGFFATQGAVWYQEGTLMPRATAGQTGAKQFLYPSNRGGDLSLFVRCVLHYHEVRIQEY